MSHETERPGPRARVTLATVLGLVALLLLLAEAATRRAIIPASRIERRTDTELRAAKHVAASGPPTALIVGNSLLLHAVDADSLNARLTSHWTMRRLVVEQTFYMDWWYGMRALWSQGAAPRVLVLMLDPGQLVTDRIRGDYTAFRLASFSDVVPMGNAAHLHPTETSRLVLSRLSAYYGFRGEFRKVLLGRLLPDVPPWMLAITPRAKPSNADADITAAAAHRLQQFQDAAAAHGARFVFVVPPLLSDSASTAAVAAAGQRAHVPVIVPSSRIAYTAQDFTDGYHMSPGGASKFMVDLAAQLDALLTSAPDSGTRR